LVFVDVVVDLVFRIFSLVPPSVLENGTSSPPKMMQIAPNKIIRRS
jgi:hypothetical protein